MGSSHLAPGNSVTLFLLFVACSSPPEKDPASPFEYQVWFTDDQVGLETQLTFKGEVVGRVQKYKDYRSDSGVTKRAFGKVTLPMNWDDDPDAKLGLMSSTPCGPVNTPLGLDKKPTATLTFKTPQASDLPPSSVVYHGFEGAVSIGEAELKSSREGWAISGLKCAAEHEIKVDGKVVGTMTAPDNSDFVFVSEGPEHCYNVTSATYSSEHGASFDTQLKGAWAYGLTLPINGLFEDAPESIRMTKIDGKIGLSMRYLNRMACPAE